MEFMFDLQDWTGDGTIDEDEFIQFCTAFGVPSKEAKNAYDIISRVNQCFHKSIFRTDCAHFKFYASRVWRLVAEWEQENRLYILHGVVAAVFPLR